jgi:hypothetical protein
MGNVAARDAYKRERGTIACRVDGPGKTLYRGRTVGRDENGRRRAPRRQCDIFDSVIPFVNEVGNGNGDGFHQ